MPKIPEYEASADQVQPLPGRSPERLFAEPQSFGAALAAGMEHAGADVQDATAIRYDTEQRQEVSDVNAQMAQQRGYWTAEATKRATSMKPGDPTFSDDFMRDMQTGLSKLGDNIQTKAGQQAYQRESASLTADMLAATTHM